MNSISQLTELPSKKVFYNEYVKRRAPVVLRGMASKVLETSSLPTLDVLLASLPSDEDRTVQVNRKSPHSTFSPMDGSKVEDISILQLCKELKENSSDSSLYMTTQPLPCDEEGQPSICSWLANDALIPRKLVPLRPSLLHQLIPMNSANLWMGRSASPTSSGLHHDFHDNLYVLTQGQKQIRIAPPDSIHSFEMSGSFQHLHPNGRIVYEGDGDVRPDGALSSVERILELEMERDRIEASLQEENMPERSRQEGDQRINGIEEQLLEIEMENADGSDDSSCEDSKEGDEDSGRKFPTKLPPNFVVAEKKPITFQHVTIEASDVLYLPAGWFHDVSSCKGIHFAINYWMHPPDIEGTFDKPYVSSFWQRDWESRERESFSPRKKANDPSKR